VEWIDLAEDWDKWRAILKRALNLRVRKMTEICLLAEEL
jgi:hypothetical protein